MIYFELSLSILNLFTNERKSINYTTIQSKSKIRSNDLKNILAYLVYLNYLTISEDNFIITEHGEYFKEAFTKYKPKTINILERLQDVFPQTLSKRECAGNLPITVFRNIFILLRDKEYIEVIPTASKHEIIRLSEKGFLLLDYLHTDKKINQLL